MRHLFIINPVAGRKGSTQALLDQLDRVSFPHERVFTEGEGHAEKLARQAAQTGEPVRIWACGGDGTLNEVVNGAAGFDNAAITCVPKGTGNDFLKVFGPNYRDLFYDLEALAAGPQTTLDLMDCNGKLGLDVVCGGVDARIAAGVHRYKDLPFVTGKGAYILSEALAAGPQTTLDLMDCNGKLGLDVVCGGVDARIAAGVHRYKDLPFVTGKGAYILSLIENIFLKGICRPMEVQMGPVHYSGPTAIVCVCNGRYYGGGFMPVADAMPDDGVLDMLLVGKVSLLTFIRLVGQYAKGRYKDYPQLIENFHGQELTWSSKEPLVAVVDGEVLESTSFTVRLSEKKIHFFYPNGASYAPHL